MRVSVRARACVSLLPVYDLRVRQNHAGRGDHSNDAWTAAGRIVWRFDEYIDDGTVMMDACNFWDAVGFELLISRPAWSTGVLWPRSASISRHTTCQNQNIILRGHSVSVKVGKLIDKHRTF